MEVSEAKRLRALQDENPDSPFHETMGLIPGDRQQFTRPGVQMSPTPSLPAIPRHVVRIRIP